MKCEPMGLRREAEGAGQATHSTKHGHEGHQHILEGEVEVELPCAHAVGDLALLVGEREPELDNLRWEERSVHGGHE